MGHAPILAASEPRRSRQRETPGQYAGRVLGTQKVVFTVDTNGVFTVLKVSGTSTDICAALSA
jgi:hypothetical protein